MSGSISVDRLSRMQSHTTHIRNICILAHVDHGKTTLSDYLVMSNGIISSKMAGQVRYLDSRDDEQQRGITMKSSSISLVYAHAPLNFAPTPQPAPAPAAAPAAAAATATATGASAGAGADAAAAPAAAAPATAAAAAKPALKGPAAAAARRGNPPRTTYKSPAERAKEAAAAAAAKEAAAAGGAAAAAPAAAPAPATAEAAPAPAAAAVTPAAVAPAATPAAAPTASADTKVTDDTKSSVVADGSTGGAAAVAAAAAAGTQPYLINLIDSPGHVDFSSEVSNAVRLSDGALVLIDVVEGLCVQTQAVLAQAWAEGVTCALVLNKMDRLVTELKLSPLEAYSHIQRLLEKVNAFTSTLLTSEAMQKAAAAAAAGPDAKARDAAAAAASAAGTDGSSGSGGKEKTDESYYVDIDDNKQLIFSPERGNVIFCSAYDCWAFAIPQFAALYSSKLGMNRRVLEKVLWGDYYYNPKTKTVTTKPPPAPAGKSAAAGAGARPMFVQLVLENIWALYDQVLVKNNDEALQKFMTLLQLKIPVRELAREARPKLQAIFSRWLPVPTAVLGMVVDHLPSPVAAQQHRIERFWPSVALALAPPTAGSSSASAPGSGSATPALVPVPTGNSERDVLTRLAISARQCDKAAEHILVFVSKMIDLGERGSKHEMTVRKAAVATRQTYVRGRFKPTGPGDAAAAPVPATPATTAAPVAVGNGTVELEDRLLREMRGLDVRKKQAAAADTPDDASTPRSTGSGADTPHRTADSKGSRPDAADSKAKERDDSERFVGFARIFAGTLSTAPTSTQVVHIFGPKYDPTNPATAHHAISIPARELSLYLFMGRDIEILKEVPAGNVFGLGGVGHHLLKTGTISTLPRCPPFRAMVYQSAPIMRVAIEPVHAADMMKLMRGLKLLNQADPNVRVRVQETGEHVIVCAGELHLERCVRDLRERFAVGVETRVSEPLVGFRETVVWDDSTEGAVAAASTAAVGEAMEAKAAAAALAAASSPLPLSAASVAAARREKRDKHRDLCVTVTTPNRAVSVRIRIEPLPPAAVQFLDAKRSVITRIMNRRSKRRDFSAPAAAAVPAAGAAATASSMNSAEEAAQHLETEQKFVVELRKHFCVPKYAFGPDDVDRIWSFGPRRNGANVLINAVPDLADHTSFTRFLQTDLRRYGMEDEAMQRFADDKKRRDRRAAERRAAARDAPVPAADTPAGRRRHEMFASLESSVLSGFQLATGSGPLCEQPMMGVAFVVEAITFHDADAAADAGAAAGAGAGAGAGAAAAGASGADSKAAPADGSSNSSSGSSGTVVAWGPLSGQVIAVVKDACRACFCSAASVPGVGVRLMEPLYRVDLQCTTEQLGHLFPVIGKRRGTVVSDRLREGTNIFDVQALLPVATSFGFAAELRTKTGGSANPQLMFHSYTTIAEDPFWAPVTEAEIEDHGADAADAQPNVPRQLIDSVRKRKGLAVDQKIVAHAQKQRTLARKR